MRIFSNEINAVDSMSDTVGALDERRDVPPAGPETPTRPLAALRAKMQKLHQPRVAKYDLKIEMDPLSCMI
jgi:hypothetical protein